MRRTTLFLLAAILALGAAAAAHRARAGDDARLAPDPASLRPIPRTAAERVFENFRALEGTWHGSSTKGWQGRVTYKTIARDSVVLGLSHFLEQDTGGMATAVHLDGDRLLLTHYCEARNQPRLVASSLSEDGRTVTFTFLDATNLPSRDRGHMDKVIWRFESADRFTTRWTWYQDGKENWMEEIRYTRLDE